MERNAEIEDVLSSIRRLVSEEVRTQEPLVDIADTRVAEPESHEQTDKLVLTSAFRVQTDVEIASKPISEPAVLHLTDVLPISPEVEQGATADDLRDAARVLSADDFAVETVLPDEDVAQANARLESLEDTIAELESVVSEQNIDFEPDGSEEVGSSPEVEALEFVPQFVSASRREVREAIDVEGAADEVVDLNVEKGEVEPLEAAAPDVVTAQAEDVVFHHTTEEPVEDKHEAGAASAEDDDEAFILDEDSLRELVRDLVREELQGVLGERITRNVRKLVRTEINRVLASQEFE
ncbi:MAG: hypothetical protein ABJO67_09575 [Pseudoruegeria sp.]